MVANLNGTKVIVTGATGLVGFQVVKQLVRAGCDVVAAVRASSKTDALMDLKNRSGKVAIAVADVSDVTAMTTAMSGCTAVVHCAGSVDMQAPREEIYETNVQGTRNALIAAIKAGVQQFIHVSSLSVITGKEDQYNVDETAPLRYSGEAYADSKVDAEKVVVSESNGIQTTILRPGFIYGPGERAWMPRLISNIKAGKAMLIDGGVRATNVIYVENLARAVELSLLNPAAYGNTYNLTDGKTPTKKELFDAICDGLGLPRVTKSIPRPVAQVVFGLVAAVSPVMSKETRQKLARFSPGAYRLAAVNQGFSTKRAEQELGYTDLIPFSQGMAETLKTFSSSPSRQATTV